MVGLLRGLAQAAPQAGRVPPSRHPLLERLLPAVVVILAAVMTAPAQAQRSGLRIRLEPTWLNPYGHDQHVLTIHQVTLAPPADHKTAITLDSQEAWSYVGGLEYSSGPWTWGLDFFWFDTKQQHPGVSLAAGEGADAVQFEVADLSFLSSNSSEVLFYRVLEDTELALWTLDAYAVRTLGQSGGGHLGLQFGVRFADFDNDYRAIAGLEGSNGLRIDASSNYGRMTGPLVGLRGGLAGDRVDLEGSLSQSVVIGEPALEMLSRQFTGPADSPTFTTQEIFETTQDIAIPISELRIKATFRLLDQVSLGGGVMASVWWDVAVPPGIIPVPGGDQVLHENTLVFFGLMGILEIRF